MDKRTKRTVEIAEQFIIHRDAAKLDELRQRQRQRDAGWTHNLHADYAEGSSAAWNVACSLVAAMLGYSSIEEAAGRDAPEPTRMDTAIVEDHGYPLISVGDPLSVNDDGTVDGA